MSYSIGDQIVKSLNLPYEMHLRPGYLWNFSKLMLIYAAVTRIALCHGETTGYSAHFEHAGFIMQPWLSVRAQLGRTIFGLQIVPQTHIDQFLSNYSSLPLHFSLDRCFSSCPGSCYWSRFYMV